MNQWEIAEAAMIPELTLSHLLEALMPIVGIGALVLFAFVICSVFGMCRSESKQHFL